MKKYYLNTSKNSAYVFENNKKRKLKVNTRVNFANAKLAAAFHNTLSLKQQSKIPWAFSGIILKQVLIILKLFYD